MRNCKNLLISALLAMATGFAKAEVVVVVSATAALDNLSKAQVADIFLGKSSTFPNGALAVPLELPQDSSQRTEFHTKVTGKSATLLRSYWAKLVFSGKGSPPLVVPSGAQVKKLVASNPSMIGYIDKGDIDNSVHVVLAP